MIFSELYSVYYHTVAKILTEVLLPGATEQTLQRVVMENAFSESALTILPSLQTQKWPLLHKNLRPVLHHAPSMPLTLLQKRWLKALMDDPRLKLFDITMPELDSVTPLFSREDYQIFDQYGDGDPYEEEAYIRHFRILLNAINTKRPVVISIKDRFGKIMWVRFYPTGLEYSAKDDKFRVTAKYCRFQEFNLGRILTCDDYDGTVPWKECLQETVTKNLTLLVKDERNALERTMLHFAHFKKRTERSEDGNYLLHLNYQVKDEPEMVIRVLSFGPHVQAIAPVEFVDRIKEKLKAQRSCEL